MKAVILVAIALLAAVLFLCVVFLALNQGRISERERREELRKVCEQP